MRPSWARSGCARCGLFLAAVFLLSVVLACSGDKQPEPGPDIEPYMWDLVLSMATGSQKEALKDGVVTFEEYEQATLRAVACLQDKGFEVRATLDPATQFYSIAATGPTPRGKPGPDNPDLVAQSAAANDCYHEHFNAIHQAWSAQHMPSESDLQAARQALAQCLRDAGLDIPNPASTEDFVAVRSSESFYACATKVQQEFGIPYFTG